MTQINSYNGGAALPGDTVTRDKIKSLTLQHNPTGEGQATDVVYSPLEGKTVPVRNLVIKDLAGNTVGMYDPLANTATVIKIPDNGKVAVESGAVAGFLKDVLVSASDMVNFVPSGNRLITNLTLPSDVVRDSAYMHIDASTANPLMNGTAAVGVSTKYAREDHVHPSDTSREEIANKTTVVLGTSDSKYPTDKAVAEFVNSSIATNTANYISNNGEPFTSVEQLEAYSGPVTNNDYAFVTGIDSEGNTYYDRYKATVSGSTVTWALEYRLNNSSFTAAQWSAINSGITSALVAKIHTHSNKDVLDGITSSDIANWNGKMDRQTVGNVSEPVYLENGIAKVATNVATKTETEQAISNSVDQTYSPTSTKAQSGVAVNEAFKTRETSTSDNSYTYLGMSKNYGGTEELYWKLVSFNTVSNYWTLQFEIDVSNGRKSNGSYDTEIYETKRLTICGKTPGSLAFANVLRYAAQGLDSSRGYNNNIYYEIGSSNLVTVYIKAANFPNETQICRLKDVINIKGISNITWYEPVGDAGTQPTNPVKFKELFPAIASTLYDIGSDSVPVYVNRGKPVSCNSSNLKAGKDDDGNVIKNTYQKKLTFDSAPTAGSNNPVTSDGIKTAIDTVNAKGLTIKEISGEQVICFE